MKAARLLILLLTALAAWLPVRADVGGADSIYTAIRSDIRTDLRTLSLAPADTVPEDSVALASAPVAPADTTPGSRNWWKLLRKWQLNLQDTTVEWPRFLKFCVDVYNWGDRFFNTTDTNYIKGTGRRWKAMLRSDNWVDSYAMRVDKTHLLMLSDVVCNLGFYVSYMAVSVGYQLDMTNVIGNQPINHKKAEFNFNCALFSVDLYYNENRGGSYLRRLTGYHDGKIFKEHITGVRLKNYGLAAYFFLNNKKYSNGAAYNFSRIQVRSAGSFIFGFAASQQDVGVNFNELPSEILQHIPDDHTELRFHYNDFGFSVGYGYNWVFRKNWLFNISAMPRIGWKHCLENCVGGRRDIFSVDVSGKMSVTYNNKDFFASLVGKMDGHWYQTKRYSFFNSIESVVVNVGVRF